MFGQQISASIRPNQTQKVTFCDKITSVINSQPFSHFGEALRYLRKRNRMTQDELGRVVGYSREQIARLENGSRHPDVTAVRALFAPALKLDAQQVDALLQLAQQARTKRTATYQLPAPLVALIGRSAELRHLTHLLPQTRLLTLVGAPGIGKTRLALAVGRECQPRFADGAAFVSLAAVEAVVDVSRAVLTALGITQRQDDEATVLSQLANQQVLLVLDNCEQLLPELSLVVAGWLEQLPHLTLLCTSREPLDLYGEQLYTVPPLAVPQDNGDLRHLATVPALALLLVRIKAWDSSWVLSAENAHDLTALCRLLDGLPLALELAAVRLRDQSAATILNQLNSVPDTSWLRQQQHNIAPRHRTLQRAIEWSVRLLSAEQQQTFARLSLFRGGCDEAAALAVTNCERTSLLALTHANLIQWHDERINLLEPLRLDAYMRLVAGGQLAIYQERHAVYYASVAADIWHGMLGDAQAIWAERALRDHDNLLTALRWAIDTQNGELAIEIAGRLWWFWYRHGFLTLGRDLLTAALQLTTPNLNQRAIALNGLASICMEQGDTTASLSYHQAGLTLRRQLNDETGVATVLHNMGLTAHRMGDYEQAIDWLLESISHDEQENALNYAHLGLIAQEIGDLQQGQRWLEQAYALAQSADSWTQAFVACNYADLQCASGDVTHARQLAERSLQLFSEQQDELYISDVQLVLAQIALAEGMLQESADWCEQAVSGYRRRQQAPSLVMALLVQAQVAWQMADRPMAAHALAEAETTQQQAAVILTPRCRLLMQQVAELIHNRSK